MGLRLATDKSLATLPLALQFLTSMLTTIPASFLMKAVGRQAGFIVGTLLGLVGAGLAAGAIVGGNFLYFCVAAALIGAFNGFGTYYRFAAADVASADYRSRAISYVMTGGVVAAVIGPNLAHWTSEWLSGIEFAGSYLSWWHCNVARSQFSLQGWRREKVYPDFIFAVQRDDGSARIAVLEMKGQHLAGNDDTEYKRAVLQLMSQHFAWDTAVPAGTMELVRNGGETVECDLVLMSEWQRKLPGFLTSA